MSTGRLSRTIPPWLSTVAWLHSVKKQRVLRNCRLYTRTSGMLA